MSDSRVSGLYKLNVAERIAELERRGWLSASHARDLQAGRQVISAVAADKIIENVVGVFGLPFAIAPNFIVNEREYIVPLVVEEPSIVAALSSAAALARECGGFSASQEESLLAGQIHIADIADVDAAITSLGAAAEELQSLADAVHPRLKARGGGVRDIEFRALDLPDGTRLVVVHVLVDTCDAMGANLVNTICESIAPRIEQISGGAAVLQILSNLADRSIVSATASFPIDALATTGMSGAEVRDRIVLANEIAVADPHRAATHNKGVMNGIDALAIATGNDWRAIEAGAHAYAARNGRYAALTRWLVGADGELLGEIGLPLKVGIVGGTATSNPAAILGLAIVGVESASQLAELMAAVGLAQNFAALRALVTGGIQKGHMRLHARSVAAAAGTPDSDLDELVGKLIESREVKIWKAQEILAEQDSAAVPGAAFTATAAGKIILLGEHAAVYGRHVLALPIVDAVHAAVTASEQSTTLTVRDWGLRAVIDRTSTDGIDAVINLLLERLGVADDNFTIHVRSKLPRGMGLGSSAAIVVAIARAIGRCKDKELDDEEINAIAFACEKLAHGTPSGIDNTISCYASAMLFRKADSLHIERLEIGERPPVVVGFSREMGLTRNQVAGVKARFDRNSTHYNAIFDQIDEMSIEGAKALRSRRYTELGALMNICHGLLNAIQVSTPDLENMVALARQSGAVGAKLTGAGGGGAMVALCPGFEDQVRSALQRAGYATLATAASNGAAID